MELSQARTLEWVAISFSRALPQLGTEPEVSASPALAGGFFTTEPPWKPLSLSHLIGKRNTQSPEQ